MRRNSNIFAKIDWLVVLIYLLLVFAGWINIYAAVYDDNHHSIFDVSQKYGKQMIWIIAAFVIGFVILLIDYRFFSITSVLIYAGMMLLLAAVLLFGKEVNGARSWFEIGSIRLQPSEFAKLATTLMVARILSKPNFIIHRFKNLIHLGIILVIPMLLILLQNDTGSALVYSSFVLVFYREGLTGWVLVIGVLTIALFIVSLLFAPIYVIIFLVTSFLLVFIKMAFHKKKAINYSILIVLSAAILVAVNHYLKLGYNSYLLITIPVALFTPFYLYAFLRKKVKAALWIVLIFWGAVGVNYSVDYVFNEVLEQHHRKRINDLLGIESDLQGWGYNVNQSKIAIGSGGFAGKGFLKGTQTKFNFVPEQSTDFIFCTVGEEWGFLGSLFVILLFVGLLIKIIQIAERQRSTYARVYAYGVFAIFLFHFTINIGMTIGILPVIGIPLPFFSYGGSSLWVFTIFIFILLNMDAHRFELIN